MKNPTSVQLKLDDSNSLEPGSTLRGTVQVKFASPSTLSGTFRLCSSPLMPPAKDTREDQKDNSDNDDAVGTIETIVVSIEGFERTSLTLQDPGTSYPHYRHRRSTFTDEYRFLYEEKKYLVASAEDGVVDFSLDLPNHLPDSVSGKMCTFDRSRGLCGDCSVLYDVTAHWQRGEDSDGPRFPRRNSSRLCSSHWLEVKQKMQLVTSSTATLRLSVSSMVEVPNYFCGVYLNVSKTYSLSVDPVIDQLELSPGQKIQVTMQEDGQDNMHNLKKGTLVVKLTQKTRLFARRRGKIPKESPDSLETWKMHVDSSTGTVALPPYAAKNLLWSYTGTLIHFHHELIVYVLDSKSNSVLATTQPIPVLLSPGDSNQ